MKCKICGAKSLLFGNTKITGKYFVDYYYCPICGFMQTEDPYWLPESYSTPITKSDVGLINRNLLMAEKTRNFILLCLDPGQRFVDYGGGYGLFTRWMRDLGFDFYHYDPVCQNLFAEGFEASPRETYSLVTAWEVLEHLVDPLTEIRKMLDFGPFLLFSTLLLPDEPMPLPSWWYYGVEHGQHVALYSQKTISYIANAFNQSVLFSNGSLHLIGKPGVINPLKLRIGFNNRFKILRKILGKKSPPSLTNQDFLQVTKGNSG